MPKLIKERCGYCGGCASVCPKNVITVLEADRTVDDTGCNKCNACVLVCPAKALVKG